MTTPEAATNVASLAVEYAHVGRELERIETKLRIKHLPSLIERAPALEVDDTKRNENSKDNNGKSENEIFVISCDGTEASLRRKNLRMFSLSMIASPPSFPFASLLSLDVSNNELMDLPGLASTCNLEKLNISRGWFNTLPLEIGFLSHLETLNASRNFLRPNAASLLFPALKSLSELRHLDLTYNQKCGTKAHRDFIQSQLPQVTELKVTLWEEVGSVPGSYVGASAAERDALLLRSQLEPWGTVHLRRRLVRDFGQPPTDAKVVDRAAVMQRLLDCYRKEGFMSDDGRAMRPIVYVDGTPVSQNLIDQLLSQLRAWTHDTAKCNRERPSIKAKHYMILRAPKQNEKATPQSGTTRASRTALRAAKKLEKYRNIWDMAREALKEVDPKFADRCTEIAVTYGFQGSPHIDKQNCGPFYGLALGNFPTGQGGVCVECSARLVAVVNTHNRLGHVDGRYPHWVDKYDEDAERYSLIYYETGGNFLKPGPAVFSTPKQLDA